MALERFLCSCLHKNEFVCMWFVTSRLSFHTVGKWSGWNLLMRVPRRFLFFLWGALFFCIFIFHLYNVKLNESPKVNVGGKCALDVRVLQIPPPYFTCMHNFQITILISRMVHLFNNLHSICRLDMLCRENTWILYTALYFLCEESPTGHWSYNQASHLP